MAVKHVLFVCTGNTCRSPLAEALLREKAREDVVVKSAGVHASFGSFASEGTRHVLNQRGIDLLHQSQPVTSELLEWADLVLTMTAGHRQLVITQFPEYKEKVFTLKGYVNEEGEDIVDPFGGPIEGYEQMALEIEECINKLNEVVLKGRKV